MDDLYAFLATMGIMLSVLLHVCGQSGLDVLGYVASVNKSRLIEAQKGSAHAVRLVSYRG